MTGKFPKRKYNVLHGSYPKKGWLKENQWEGIITAKEAPHVLNPKSGYIASANNFATSKNTKYGLSHGFSFATRSLRISEMINDKIQSGKKINAKDMMEIQTDTLDIQARDSLKYMIDCVNKGLKSTLEN